MGKKNALVWILAILGALLACGGIFLYAIHDTSSSTQEKVAYPHSIGAIGDSMSRGFNTEKVNKPTVANNWATGSNPKVNSIALQISKQSGTQPEVHNVAVPGDSSKDLLKQVTKLNESKPAFTTFLIGPNDLCISGGNLSGMTSVDTFRSRVKEALETIHSDTKIFVGSVIDLQRLLEIGKSNDDAREIWDAAKICQVMLANPLSTDPGDIARRNEVAMRTTEYNQALKDACSVLENCTYDDGALYNTQFTASDLSTIDYFHPSIKGQAKIAEAVWPLVEKIYE